MAKSLTHTWLPKGKIVEISRNDDGSFHVIMETAACSGKQIVVALPKGDIIEVKRLENKTFVILQELNIDFVFIEASGLSMADVFLLQFDPRTESEKDTKELIEEAIRRGVENFYCRICDPSFTEDKEGICFESGKTPAVCKSYNWNEKAAREYAPEYNSRLGTRLQYGAFLGVFIKKLVDTGLYTIQEAWNEVCNNSRSLGYYPKDDRFHPTGVDRILDLYDFANTFKILAPDEGEEGFWLASGSTEYAPIAHLCHCTDYGYDSALALSTAWVVTDA